MDTNPHEPEYLTVFMCFVLAMLGGTAKELSNFEASFNAKRFFSNIFVAGFSGLLVGLLAPDFEHKNWIMFVSGLSGVLGISFLDYCGEILKTLIAHFAQQAIQKEIKRPKKKSKKS